MRLVCILFHRRGIDVRKPGSRGVLIHIADISEIVAQVFLEFGQIVIEFCPAVGNQQMLAVLAEIELHQRNILSVRRQDITGDVKRFVGAAACLFRKLYRSIHEIMDSHIVGFFHCNSAK